MARSTSRAAASSTSAPASPSTPPATATPGWSTPSPSRPARWCTPRSWCTTPATSSWPSASARCARSSTSPQVFFCNSGAEAVDGALKLARKVTGRPGVIAFRRAFHGRTLAATTLTTAKGRYREGYEPLLPGVYHAPYCVPHEHATPDAAVAAALGRARPRAAAAGAAGQRGRDDRRAGARRGRLRAAAPGLAGRACASAATTTASCSCSTRCSAASGRTGRPFAAETYGVRPDVAAVRQGHRLGAAARRHRRRPRR